MQRVTEQIKAFEQSSSEFRKAEAREFEFNVYDQNLNLSPPLE